MAISIDVVSVARRLGHISNLNTQDQPEAIVHGYVAQDVSEQAVKEGADVTLTSLFKKEDMTAAEQEVNDAMHEGVTILNGVMPVKIEKMIIIVQLQLLLLSVRWRTMFLNQSKALKRELRLI